MPSTHGKRNKHANFLMDSERSFEYRWAIGGNMVACNASPVTVITLVASRRVVGTASTITMFGRIGFFFG